jgi:hypothetical protein
MVIRMSDNPLPEHEWYTSSDARAVIDAARPSLLDRRRRATLDLLVARFILARWPDDRLFADAAEVLRRHAHRTATEGELDVALQRIAEGRACDGGYLQGDAATVYQLLSPIQDPRRRIFLMWPPALALPHLRDVVPYPGWRDLRADHAWLSWAGGLCPKLAEAIDHEGAYERLPILADALEEAGCADTRLLGHLRRPDGHGLGCWAVGLLLGRFGRRPN